MAGEPIVAGRSLVPTYRLYYILYIERERCNALLENVLELTNPNHQLFIELWKTKPLFSTTKKASKWSENKTKTTNKKTIRSPPKLAEMVNHQVPSPSIKFQIPRWAPSPRKFAASIISTSTPPNPNQGTKKSNHSTQAALVQLFALGKHLDVISQLEKYIIRKGAPFQRRKCLCLCIYIYIHIHISYMCYTSSSRASRGRKFQKKKELYSKERICL